MINVDSIIIGGGIAGLYAAMQLQEKQQNFLLLEAKPRLGGRVLGKPVPLLPKLRVDLGPTWFWPHQHRMQALVKKLNVECFEQYTKGDVLYQLSPTAAPTRHAGLGAMLSLRVKGGMQSLIQALQETIAADAIKTSHVVKQVARIGGCWQVKAEHLGTEQIFTANKLLMAVPPRIIKSYFTPENYLSPRLAQHLGEQQTWMSGQAKFVAVYNAPFWREDGLAGQAMSRIGPMVEIHDATASIDQGAALFGFIGIPALARQQYGTGDLKTLCLRQLTDLFGEKAATPEAVYLNDWANDPFVATQKDIREPPNHAQFHPTFFTEMQDINLYMVASEFAQKEAGYLEGALNAVDKALPRM